MAIRFPDDRFVRDAIPRDQALSRVGTAIADEWKDLGAVLAANAAEYETQARELDLEAAEANGLHWLALKAWGLVYGGCSGLVRTAPAVLYGSADFALNLIKAPVATAQSIVPAFQSVSHTFWQGGGELLKGNLSQGTSNLLYGGLTGGLMVKGGLGMLKGAVRASAEALREMPGLVREVVIPLGTRSTFAPVLMPVGVIKWFGEWWTKRITIPHLLRTIEIYGTRKTLLELAKERPELVTPEIMAALAEVAKKSDSAVWALGELGRARPDLVTPGVMVTWAEAAGTRGPAAWMLSELVLERPELATAKVMVTWAKASGTSCFAAWMSLELGRARQGLIL